jgi:hypothetical protein
MISFCWKLGFRLGPVFLATPLPRSGGRVGLIAAVLQEVFGMRGDPGVGKTNLRPTSAEDRAISN